MPTFEQFAGQKVKLVDAAGNDVSYGATSISTNQGTATSSSAQIVPARTGRAMLRIENTGSVDMFIGPSGVTTANGKRLKQGEWVDIHGGAAVHAVTATDPTTFDYIESF